MASQFHKIASDKRKPLSVVMVVDHPTGLNAGRALKMSGSKVLGLTNNPKAIECQSRAWSNVYNISGYDWLPALQFLAEKVDQQVFLLPTQDHLVSKISRYRNELPEIYKFVLPHDAIVQTFLDKARFYNWAQPFGFPLPYSIVVNNPEELQSALNEMPYPIILKPFSRISSWDKFSPSEKCFKLKTADDLNRIPFDLFSASTSFILSNWIEGPDDSVYYCLAYCGAPGEITRYYTGRKLLQYPRQNGSTAICVGSKNEEVLEITREVFKQANFEGIGSLEIKYDNKGKAFITEPTVGRPNLQSYSAVAAGCNLHALAMDFALTQTSPNRNAISKNCYWMMETALYELITTRDPKPIPWRLLINELLSVRRIGGAYWNWKDPAVFLKLISRKILSGLKKIIRNLKTLI